MTLLSLPAIRLIRNYQHIWNPLIADVSKNESGAGRMYSLPASPSRFDSTRIHELADRGQDSLIDVVPRFACGLEPTFR